MAKVNIQKWRPCTYECIMQDQTDPAKVEFNKT